LISGTSKLHYKKPIFKKEYFMTLKKGSIFNEIRVVPGNAGGVDAQPST